jgi:predicted GIY-YIG superfamily endonuclease
MHSTDPAPGTVYLIHLDAAYKHARHYIGWTADLDTRLEAHRNGRGARLMEVITDAGITWRLARTWPGGRDRERAIKDRHNAPRLCPVCSPQPQPVKTGRSSVIATARQPVLAPPQPLRVSPAERGLRMGEQFLNQRAGWTAEQLTAAYEYITRPYLEAPHHTTAQDDEFCVFTQTVTSRITQLSAVDGGHALGGYQ